VPRRVEQLPLVSGASAMASRSQISPCIRSPRQLAASPDSGSRRGRVPPDLPQALPMGAPLAHQHDAAVASVAHDRDRPGCSTISRPARLPSAVSTVSSWTVSNRPWNTVRRSTGCSLSKSSIMVRSLTAAARGRSRRGRGPHARRAAVVGCPGRGSIRSHPARRSWPRRSEAHQPHLVERRPS